MTPATKTVSFTADTDYGLYLFQLGRQHYVIHDNQLYQIGASGKPQKLAALGAEVGALFAKRQVSGGAGGDGPVIRVVGQATFGKVIVARTVSDWNLHGDA